MGRKHATLLANCTNQCGMIDTDSVLVVQQLRQGANDMLGVLTETLSQGRATIEKYKEAAALNRA